MPRKARMARNGQMVRGLRLIALLRSSRYGRTLAELAEELGACERTIYRDLAALQEAGIVVERLSDSPTARWRAPTRGAFAA